VISAVFRKNSMPLPEPANMQPGSRVSGWRFLYTLIQNDSWFISEMCPLALEAIPSLEYDSDKGGEDIRKTDSIYDDIGDELRYGLADMLNNVKKPFSVTMQEQVSYTAQKYGPTQANIVRMKMEEQRKKNVRYKPQY
jgi:hypothetical protein